jgi:translation initiation factor RLI1
MKFEDAIEKSIKAFLDGKLPEELVKVQDGEILYTPEYMDEMAEEFADLDLEDEVEEDV